MEYVGVDGCRAGWLAISLDEADRVDFKCFAEFRELYARYHDAQSILVDMPIGLPWKGCPTREADFEARAFMKRSSSVFPAPLRTVVHAATAREMWEINNRDGGKLTPFGKAIVPKIREVDLLLGEEPAAKNVVRECHPEVCFASLNKGPLKHRKRTYAGMFERVRLLERYYGAVGELLDEIYVQYTRSKVATDDIVDALMLAVTAREAKGNLYSLPKDPPMDETGLPMAIWYHDFV